MLLRMASRRLLGASAATTVRTLTVGVTLLIGGCQVQTQPESPPPPPPPPPGYAGGPPPYGAPGGYGASGAGGPSGSAAPPYAPSPSGPPQPSGARSPGAQSPGAPPPGGQPPGAQGTYGGQAPYGAQAPYGNQPPQGTPPGSSAPSPTSGAAPPAASDPITKVDLAWLRQRAVALMQELIAVLPDVARQRVQAVPLAIDDTPGEVNAFAACVDGKAVMVVTDGLLDIVAHLAAARANDDVFGSRKVDEYVGYIASNQQPGRPVLQPPRGFFDAAQQADARRVARQHDVLDETLGFVLGHELAHHHLGHLPCTGGAGPLGMGSLARGLSSSVPLLNQPNELAADTAGTDTVLAAGARRSGYHLTEGGGLLMMHFFSAVDQLSAVDILFGFERTHPPPVLRVPVIQQAANFWRLSGGAWAPLPRF